MEKKHRRAIAAGKKKPAKAQARFLSILDPDAPFAYVESYKSLRTNLNFISAAGNAHSFVVTSALPEESKSTVVTNLAISLASGGKSVIVVECDLRKPSLRRYLKLPRGAVGLSSVLAGTAEPGECTVYQEQLGIHILPAGAVPPNPSELLGQERMQNLVEMLKETFDYVILDAPPINLVTDAALLGRMVDGALLVIRSKFAPTSSVKLAKKKLDDVNVKIFGAVLTRYNLKKSRQRDGYYYSYEYSYGQSRGNP